MLKKILICFSMLFAILCYCGATVEADELTDQVGIYFSGKAGLAVENASYLQTKGGDASTGFGTNTAFMGGLEIGYDWSKKYEPNFRTGVEYSVRCMTDFKHNHKTVQTGAIQTVFANVYYDFKEISPVTYPYVGGGIGASFMPNGDGDVNFAWNIGGGVRHTITDNWTIGLGYRYCDYGKFEHDHTTAHLAGHEVLAELAYTF